MKKQVVASLAAAVVMGIAGTSFASSNPFVDVPAKNWAYDAVTQLVQAKIIDGMGDGRFNGTATVTRYEMAQMVAKAMANEDKANAAQKATIEKLKAEFATELEGLNVRVTNVETKQNQAMVFSGELRERANTWDVKNVTTGKSVTSHDFDNYLDLWGTGYINDNWKLHFEMESETDSQLSHNANHDFTFPGTTNNQTSRVYAQGDIGAVNVKAGRMELWSNEGVIFDTPMDGLEASFGTAAGSKLRTDLYVGQLSATAYNLPTTAATYTEINSTDSTYQYAGATVTANLSSDFTLVGAYHSLKPEVGTTNNISEGGLSYKLGDFTLSGDYAKSSLNGNDKLNKAYVGGLSYKGADQNVVNSYGASVSYMYFGNNAAVDHTYDMGLGYKGTDIEYYYVPAKNVKLGVLYYDAKAIDSTSGLADTKFYRGQVEFFF